MINPHQFINLVLEPALKACNMYSIDAMYLMATTALCESKLTHLKQLPNGPALGFMQVEWATYIDVCRYLNSNTELRMSVLHYTGRQVMPNNPGILIADLSLNVLTARIKYWMIPESIPSYKDVEAQYQYYKKYYNTAEGAATQEQFINAAKEMIGWTSLS